MWGMWNKGKPDSPESEGGKGTGNVKCMVEGSFNCGELESSVEDKQIYVMGHGNEKTGATRKDKIGEWNKSVHKRDCEEAGIMVEGSVFMGDVRVVTKPFQRTSLNSPAGYAESGE